MRDRRMPCRPLRPRPREAESDKAAQAEGRGHDITDALRDALQSGQLSDSDIESKINEMKAARTARDFKKSDAIRAELTEAGVLIEITKDGIRWRRK